MMRFWWMVWWCLGSLGAALGGRGQPEVAQSLALPTQDEVDYNHLFPFPFTGGTYHFVSSNFPEIDSRGFHESVFDEIGDYYPSWASRSIAGSGLQRTLGRKKRSVESKEEEEVASNGADEKRGSKRLGGRYVRGMEMGSSGFHGDTFNSGFGDFMTMRKRRARGSLGLHPDTFSEGFGHFQTMKRRPEMDSTGFHGDTFGGGFGEFETMKKRRPEMDSMGFHGDTFNGNFGYFETMRKRPWESSVSRPKETANIPTSRLINNLMMRQLYKRRPEMDSMGFHGDTFGGEFGHFETMKKRRPEMDSMGFHGDTFGGGFGEFETMKKRRPEMDSMGFHGDTFGGGFGEFETMKKRRPEMDSMGFHGDTFSRGFGDFDTMKRDQQGSAVPCGEGCKETER